MEVAVPEPIADCLKHGLGAFTEHLHTGREQHGIRLLGLLAELERTHQPVDLITFHKGL